MPAFRLASRYDNEARSVELIEAGKHRVLVGGKWDEIGQLQLDFLIRAGLAPDHYMLDIGCGCLRAGVKLIPYLEPNHYYGIDAEKRLLQVGFRNELVKAGVQERLDRKNLYCSRQFRHERLSENTIDFGMCCSVMTHLPLNYARICLENCHKYFMPGGKLFMTFFELPDEASFAERFTNEQGVTTTGFSDPYHYYRRDMLRAAEGTGWTANYVGPWNHPRGQSMLEFRRE